MIGKLKGILVDINVDNIILSVLDVGYIVYISSKTKAKLQLGEQYDFFIIHNIYENGVRLYGFLSKEEQKCAEILVAVKGVSYKIILNILSVLEPCEVKSAILNKDCNVLRVPGIGEKLASRIVAELFGAMSTFNLADAKPAGKNTVLEDAVSILVNLGYSSKNASLVVNDIMSKNSNIEITEVVFLALKVL